MNRLKLIIIILPLLSLCFACAGKRSGPKPLRYPSELALINCVAVMPFENKTLTDNAGEIVADILANQFLASRKFRLMFRDESESRIRNQNISTRVKISSRFAAILGELIGVDAILHGVVRQFQVRSFGSSRKPEPQVEIEARLISARSGRIIWQDQASLSGLSQPFSYQRSLVAIAQKLSKKMVDDLVSNLSKRTINLSKSCGKTVDTLDIDDDSILNIVDRCPVEAGSVETDGCPQKSKYSHLARLIGDNIFLADAVEFVGQSSELSPKSIGALKGVAEILRNNRYLRKVMIECYLLERVRLKNIKWREELAFSRARAVKDFLIGEGISDDRLTAVGYGEVDRLAVLRNQIQFQVLETRR